MTTFNDYQDEAETTAIYPPEHAMPYLLLKLAGEAGEVGQTYAKYLRDGTSSVEMERDVTAELGDVLWYVAMVAREVGVDLDEVANANLSKLASRAARGVLGGSGSHR